MRLQLIIEAFASMYHLCPGWEERQETSRSIQDVLTKLKQTRSPSERMRGKLSLLPPRREDERCINTMQDDQFWVEYTSTPPDSVEESQTTTNGHLKFYLIEDFEADLPTASYVSPRHTLECPEFSYCVLDISEDLIILEESAVPNEPDSYVRVIGESVFI